MILHFPTWHEQILEDKRFLLEFIEQIETQISKVIDDYETGKEEYQEEGYPMEYYKGMDSSEYDLHEFFYIYFPNLHRRSAFMTLYTFFEDKMVRLCKKLQVEKSISTSYTKYSGSVIAKAAQYIINDAGVSWRTDPALWQEINDIREVRNVVVHNDARIDKNDSRHIALRPYIARSTYLVGTVGEENNIKEIITLKGFLEYVLDKFYELLAEINSAMSASPSTTTT